jgi:hypothetical protein
MENTSSDTKMSFFGSQLKSTENPYGIPETTSESYTEYQNKGDDQGTDILGNILGFILFTIILLLVILFVAYAIEARKDVQPITFFSYLRYLGKTGNYFSEKKAKREIKEEVDHIRDDLHTALDKYPSSQPQPQPHPQMQDEKEYEPNQSQSQSQNGWCYIGETNNKRSCAPVDAHEKCMSGNIFPSYDLCVNPNLR